MRSLLFTLLLLCSVTFAGDAPFTLADGDRVMLLGDTLLEREATFGHLETRMHEQFPAAHFSVRNIAWSAETPHGWSRASFDPAEKGMDRLKEHIALVQPTVAVLGFGMAASLQEMTDRANDWTLNPDPARYGAEPMSAARFKKELGELMDVISASAKDAKVRFILLSPIRHEDLRSVRAGLPDPSAHNALLATYSKAIAELAKERGAAFVPCDSLPTAKGKGAPPVTDNGIHLNENGYRLLSVSAFSEALGWVPSPSRIITTQTSALTAAVLRKNALWFHRFRPANSTYLFGFRKGEQGRNAVEMDQFTPLLKAADEEIWKLAQTPAAAATVQPETTPHTPLPLPVFTLADGLEISLWADAPMLAKPVQMNWDAAGRLWVASTPIYPMIEPGKVASDKIYVLEDTDHDGKADKTTVFANGLLLPTCVEPDITTVKSGPATASYAGASTELLYLSDTNGDGVSDQQRIVLSGFGTEDTHHNIHTLYWGPDGLLYLDQSVYTHTHMETPWGVVRVNSGAVISYDPRTERTQVFAKGLWNPWGHKIDRAGQHFLTDGAGSTGLSWAFPSATFAPNEGARQTMGGISPGSYPKFAGLELIYSPHFPADWQGSAVTCDFRAHKIVHFQITDLSASGSSGYTTKELPVLVQTNDLSFRPIDVKLGPDGALYIADWTNPIINHGEVDFRDPRRDHTHGRIWRITYKGGPIAALNTRTSAGTLPAYTAKDLASDSPRTRIGAMRTLARTPSAEHAALILAAAVNAPKSDPFYTFAAWHSVNDIGAEWVQSVLAGKIEIVAEGAVKKLSARESLKQLRKVLTELTVTDPVADAELEKNMAKIKLLNAKLRLARETGDQKKAEAVALELEEVKRRIPFSCGTDDPGETIKKLEKAAEIEEQEEKSGIKKEEPKKWTNTAKELEYALGALPPELAAPVLAKALPQPLPADGSGPWIELIGKVGTVENLNTLWQDATSQKADRSRFTARAFAALADAAEQRHLEPSITRPELIDFLRADANSKALIPAARLAGVWRRAETISELTALARRYDDAARSTAFTALRDIANEPARTALKDFAADGQPAPLRAAAAIALGTLDFKTNTALIFPALVVQEEKDALTIWRALFATKGVPEQIASSLPNSMPKPAAAAGLAAARELGKRGDALVKAFTAITGTTTAPAAVPTDFSSYVARTKTDGDAARGEFIYRRAALVCTTCHAIGGAGGKVGPDLSSIGASAPLDYLIESLFVPNAKVKEGYNAVLLTQKGGAQISGVLVRENPDEFILRDITGKELHAPKAAVTARENLGSIMPAGLMDQLADRERLDLFAFLSTLGKPGAFDSSKATVARQWELWPAGPSPIADELPMVKREPGLATFTLVDGRLTRDMIAEKLALLPAGTKSLHARAHFTIATAGKAKLTLTGARKAWLDRAPLPIASEPTPTLTLTAGAHDLEIELDATGLPDLLRAESADVTFLGE